MNQLEKRQEIKIISENIGELINQILILKAKKIYKKRKIISLYFDTHDLENYFVGNEGMVPRDKIRVRMYDSFSNDKACRLETKKTFAHHREKNIINLNKFDVLEIEKKILKTRKKHYIPTLFVEYDREYYLINDVRLTLDTGIKYRRYSSESYVKDYRNVLEFKFSGNPDHNLLGKLIKENSRFSKYCEAIENLNLI